MLNKTILMGRLGRDPEKRYTQNGTAVAAFSLAVDRDFKDKASGERITDWIDVVAWRQTAEFVCKYFTTTTWPPSTGICPGTRRGFRTMNSWASGTARSRNSLTMYEGMGKRYGDAVRKIYFAAKDEKEKEENGFYCKHFRPVVRNGQFICACENAALPWSLDAMVVCNNDITLCPYVLALQKNKE